MRAKWNALQIIIIEAFNFALGSLHLMNTYQTCLQMWTQVARVLWRTTARRIGRFRLRGETPDVSEGGGGGGVPEQTLAGAQVPSAAGAAGMLMELMAGAVAAEVLVQLASGEDGALV